MPHGATDCHAEDHSPNWIDRTGWRYGHLTLLACVGRTHFGASVWRCRCECGRPWCRGTVDRATPTLRRKRAHQCRPGHRPPPPPRRAAAAALPASGLAPPEGVRPPWHRSAKTSAARDAALRAAFLVSRPVASYVGALRRDPLRAARDAALRAAFAVADLP